MNKNILQLTDFQLNKIKVDYIKAKEKALVYYTSIGYKVGQSRDNKNLFRLFFEFKLKPKNVKQSGYIIESEIIGYFTFPESFDEEDMQMVVRFNGCTILYGILRGEIANFTGSFPNGKFILPTMDMNEIVTDIIKKELTKSKKEAKIKKISKTPSKKTKKVHKVKKEAPV